MDHAFRNTFTLSNTLNNIDDVAFNYRLCCDTYKTTLSVETPYLVNTLSDNDAT